MRDFTEYIYITFGGSLITFKVFKYNFYAFVWSQKLFPCAFLLVFLKTLAILNSGVFLVINILIYPTRFVHNFYSEALKLSNVKCLIQHGFPFISDQTKISNWGVYSKIYSCLMSC